MSKKVSILSCIVGLSVTLTAFVMPIASIASVQAQDLSTAESTTSTPDTIKVGFFALDGYHEMDEDGAKSGYGYDFLHMVQKYVNLNFEYVGYDKSWEEMLEMLENGDIDMVTSAYRTDDRTSNFDYSLPIGTTSVELNTRADETRFTADDYSTYDGMTIGLVATNAESELLAEFAAKNGFSYTAEYYDDTAEMSEALQSGKVDAVAAFSLRKAENEKTLSSFGTQNFYAIVRKGDDNLLNKINYAIEQLNSSEGDWQNSLYYDNYVAEQYSDLTFTEAEQAFIERYSTGGETLVLATDNDWKPFSWKENDTYYGILPEFVEYCMEMTGMNYKYYDYGDEIFTVNAETLQDIDMYICYGLPDTDDENGMLASATIVENSSALLVRRDTEDVKTVAISQTTPNLNLRVDELIDQRVNVVMYETTDAAKQAVNDKEVDAALLYGYDAEFTVNQDMTGTLAFRMLSDDPIEIMAIMSDKGDHTLMSIMMKCINNVPEAEKNGIISKYVSFAVTSLSLKDYVTLNPLLCGSIAIAIIVALGLTTFIIIHSRATSKYSKTLEKQVNEITSLNEDLTVHQKKLQETTELQEAQLEEIRQLNEEQAAQMEEITSLNTELEDKQDQLERAFDMAESANNAKSAFLFNMSHDVRTPMNAIIGYAELLEKHQHDETKRADYLKKIQDSSDILLSIINNVLEMARIEKGSIVVDEVAWSASQFNDTLFSMFDDMMAQKGIRFTRNTNVKHQYVYCDPVKLREVYVNILSNAYNFTNSGGSISMNLYEVPCELDGYAVYQTTVTDTGIGMSEDFIPHIFEEFSRENNTTESRIEGTGLGMPIVKRLVDCMGGTIEVKSEKGKGSSFIVTIPHKIAEAAATEGGELGEVDTSLFAGRRILLAEDNELNAEIAIEILEEGGFVVDRAEDGVIAVDMFKNAEDYYYDLILMDIQMPNMNGYDATKAIRKFDDETKADIPIIAMTANAFEEDKRDAKRAGMNAHLAKPVKVEDLYRALAEILRDQKRKAS